MKKFLFFSIVLAVSASPLAASVRYVQLMPDDSVATLAPTDIVEIISVDASGAQLRLDFRDGSFAAGRGMIGKNFIFTDLVSINSFAWPLCVKITSNPQSQSRYIQATPLAQSFPVDPSALVEFVGAAASGSSGTLTFENGTKFTVDRSLVGNVYTGVVEFTPGGTALRTA
jgi:hypothetical protein